MIRPIFYNHFQDKYELLEWIIRTELLEPVEPLIRNDMIIEAMVLLFTNIELVSSTSYSCILYSQPVCLSEYRPYLHKTIDCILQAFSEDAACMLPAGA